MPPLGAAAIAAIVGAVASVGTGIASAAMGKKGDDPRNQLNQDQTNVASKLNNQFGFGQAGDPLNPNAQLGQNLLTPPGSPFGQNGFGTAQHLSQKFGLQGSPQTNRFKLGG